MRNATLFPLALSLLASSALAEQSPAPSPVSKECRQQIMALCPPNGDHKARHDCIVLNRDKISPDCIAQIKAHHDAKKAMRHDMMPPPSHGSALSPPPPPPVQ